MSRRNGKCIFIGKASQVFHYRILNRQTAYCSFNDFTSKRRSVGNSPGHA